MDLSPISRVTTFGSIFNFRDLGGYPGLDGRTVRWRRVYRSDSLHRISPEDEAAFAGLGVRTVIDLRRPHEVARDGRVPAYAGLDYRHIHPEHAEWDDTPYDEALGIPRWLADRYHDLATTGAAGLARAVATIADSDAAPVVVHCVAGKDRTGVVCALTLSVLGVDEADIAADYALSTEASERFRAWVSTQLPSDLPTPPPYYSSPAEAMLLFLRELRERYGSAERYLLASGVTPAQLAALRDHLLD